MSRTNADLDLASRVLWQHATEALLRALWEEPALRLIRHLDSRTQGIRRHADAAALVEGPHGHFIAHTEFDCGSHPKALPGRLWVYGATLFAANQGRYPVSSTLVLLKHPRPRLPSAHELRYGERTLSLYHYNVVRVAQLPPERLAEDPALAVLVPLAKGATPRDFSRAVRRVRESWPPAEARELLTTLYITGGRSFGAALALRLIELEEVMLSETYQEILNKGITIGLEQGEERGLARGIKRGMKQGIEQGIEQGVVRGLDRARQMLAQQARLRFPELGDRLDDALARCPTDRLEALAALIVQAPTPEDLVEGARRL